MIRHCGFFEFKPEVPQEEIDECFVRLLDMVGKVDGLQKIEHGPHKSDEGLQKGFTHAFVMTFDSFEARDKYLPHPVHLAVVDYIQPRLADIVVCDFEVK